MTDSINERVSASPSLGVHERLVPLVGGLKELYSTQAFADLIIVCKGREWKVHKAVVCSQSSYFKGACTGECKEAIEGKISLEEEDPQVVDAMLHYLYNFDYGDHGNGQDDVASLVFDVRVFTIAEKRSITPLKELAAEKFAKRAETEWDTTGFAAAITEIYDIVPPHEETLEHIVVRVVKQHAKELFDESKVFDHFCKVVRETPEFGGAIATALTTSLDMSNNSDSKTYTCPSCPGDSDVFSVQKPDGANFGCPRGHNPTQSSTWWARHKT